MLRSRLDAGDYSPARHRARGWRPIQAGDTVGVFISLATLTGCEGDSAASRNGTQLTFHKVLVTAAQFSTGAPAQTQAQATQASSQGALKADSNKQADHQRLLPDHLREERR